MHPYLAQNKWLKVHQEHGIHVTAYSPLAGTNPTYDPGAPEQLLKNKKVVNIAEKRGCTPAQVVLAWGLSRGTSVIPKSSHLDRITENFHSLECVLKSKDLKKIDKLRKEYYRFNNPSGSWDVPLYEGLEDSEGEHKKHS
jgi:alcohol dehydrogenase (NADP+)